MTRQQILAAVAFDPFRPYRVVRVQGGWFAVGGRERCPCATREEARARVRAWREDDKSRAREESEEPMFGKDDHTMNMMPEKQTQTAEAPRMRTLDEVKDRLLELYALHSQMIEHNTRSGHKNEVRNRIRELHWVLGQSEERVGTL